MRRAVALGAAVLVTVAMAACTEQGSDGSGGAGTVFTTIDALHKINEKAPINPYNQESNSALGYNGMHLAWEKNAVRDDPKGYYPGVAKSWQVVSDQSKVTVKIQPDAKWSNGKPVTAEDVKLSAAVAFTQGAGAFAVKPGATGGLAGVKVVNDKTLEFLQSPGGRNNTFARGVLTMNVLAKSAFGSQVPADFWDTLKTGTSGQASAKAQKAAQDKLTALGKKLVAYGPKKDVSCGPYVLRTVNPGEAVLVKNKYYWDAKKIAADKVVLKNYSGNEQIWNYVIGQKLDAAPYTATPSSVVKKMLAKKGNEKVTGFSPVAASFAFNQKVKPFDNVHVRRGLAYAIDRELATKIGNPESGTAAKTTSGLVPDASKAQIPGTLDKLPTYDHDVAKAAKEFERAGLKKKAGKWYLSNGKRWSFTIQAPNGFSDWIAASKSISSQLTDLGVDAKFATVADYPTYLAELDQGKYDAGFWLIALGPSNYNAYQRLYGASNGWATVGNKVVHKTGKGTGNWMNGAASAGGVDPGKLTYDLSQLPVDKQQATVEKLATYTADQLPVIQIWDYTNVQFVNTTRFTNFPKDDSDVLRLSPGVWMQLGYIKAK